MTIKVIADLFGENILLGFPKAKSVSHITVMQTTTDPSNPTIEKPNTAPGLNLGVKLSRFWLCPIFALALAVRLWFAFADGHSAIVFSCDASEYLRDARGLAQLVTSPTAAQDLSESLKLLGNSLSAQEAAQMRQQFAPVKELAIAGPIFPIALLLSFATFGLPVAQTNWQAPVIFQCIITALTCVLIAFIGKHAWNRNAGIAAGIIAALYPGFIVNSIRMYSESFSCFLLCAVVALTIPVVRKSGMFHSVSAGICLAFLQLTRSVMVLVTGLTFLLTAWLSAGKSRMLRLAGLLVGMALVFAPWMLFQQLAFGKSSLVVDRVGHYNLFVGTNITTQGYLSYPYPDGRGIEKKSYATLVAAQVKESPERFARLMVDKPLRLLKYPWNDFRTPIGPFKIGAQVLFHQVMLAFAVIGLALCLFEKRENASSLRLKLLLALLLAMHAVYLVFITVPRYNLTSIPFLALFAGAGLVAVIGALKHSSKHAAMQNLNHSILTRPAAGVLLGSLALSFVFARVDWFGSILAPLGTSSVVALVVSSLLKALPLSAFFAVLYMATKQLPKEKKLVRLIPIVTALIVVPLCSLPSRSHGRINEWALSSRSANAAKQFISIPADKAKSIASRDCYVIVDSSNWQALGNGGHIVVNGVPLKSAAIPLMPFTQNLAETKSRGQNTRVEQHYLECEDIYSSLTAAAGGGNLDIRQWFAVRIPSQVINTAIAQDEPGLQIELDQKPATGSDLFGMYAESKDENVRIPSVARFSWEKAFFGVESEDGFTDSRYDDRVEVKNLGKLRTATDTTNWIKVPNIRLLVAPPALTESDLRIASVTGALNSTDTEEKNIPLNFSGIMESTDEQGKVHRYRTPWVPTSLVSTPGSNEFRFAFPYTTRALPGTAGNITVKCQPGGVAAGTDFFAVNGNSADLIKSGILGDKHVIQSLRVETFQLKSNPIGYGYEVF